MDLPVRIPTSPPRILPVEKADTRPLWSVMIPAYNCGAYLPDTLASVLMQAPGPETMQITVVDDASTDVDVERLVARLGAGRVGYFRQSFNVGSLRNFETCLNKSQGQLIHLLHGDDEVRPGFYAKMEELLARFPQAGAAFSRYLSIDEYDGTTLTSDLERPDPGLLDNWLETLACKQRIQTPAMVVRRSVYERLGGFFGVHYGEDWEMWLRIAAHYPTAYHPDILAAYRKHADSISGQYVLTGQNIRDLKIIMGISESYFPAEQWKSIGKKAKAFYAHYAINTARNIWGRQHHRSGTFRQIKEAFSLSVDKDIIVQSAKLCTKMMIGLKK